MDLTILIITKNAQDTLERTLKSVDGLQSRIVVVDEYSRDKTKSIARKFGCSVFNHDAGNFGGQRAFALTQVKTKWTLVLDCDEVLTAQNKQEIKSAIGTQEYDGYSLTFRNHLFGKKLCHGELHKKLVLFKTQNAHISSKDIHEHYDVKGKVGELPSEVLHYSYRSIGQIIRKFFRYSTLQARQYKKVSKKYGLRELVLNPAHMFYARFIKDEGYKDGWGRLFLDYQFAHMEFLSYLLIPFVKTKKRISVDCGSYSVGGIVQGGIDRLIQGIYTHASKEFDYHWFSFNHASKNRLPIRFYSQLWLPLITILRRSEIFLGMAGNIPVLLGFFPVKKILFLHDFGFFTSPDKYDSSAKRLQDQTEGSIRRADKIVVFHEAIYQEFIKRYPQYTYKAEVIPAGADHLEDISEEPIRIESKKPYILYVGVVKAVKRIDKILSVIGDRHCVIAGPQEKEYTKSLQIGKTQNVQFIQNFSDGQLKWLYKNADVMVYTSEHEGFCYPVLEALTLGLPVIAFDLPIFRWYQKYFPHLTLVKTDEEMKKELQSFKSRTGTNHNHPYTWKSFKEHIEALWQTTHLPRLNDENIGRKVAFIGVLYKTPTREIKRLEQEIKGIGLKSYELYWIDNSTNSKGYAAGINEGIRKGLMDKCELFVALNPDISLKNVTANAIDTISHEFDVWGFGMKQDKFTYYGGEIDQWRLSGGLVKTKPPHRFAEVDFVSGSILGFSKHVVQEIGLWDESYFMYYEDVDFCERAKRAGYSVGIDSDVIYEHFEVSKINVEKKKWIASSRWKFFWKYANGIQRMRELLRLPKTLTHQ